MGMVKMEAKVLSTIPFVQAASSAPYSFAISVTIFPTGIESSRANTPKITGSALKDFSRRIAAMGRATILIMVNP